MVFPQILKSYTIPNDIECLFVEINLYKKKWFIGGVYNPCKSTISRHLNVLCKCLDHYLPNYDNIVIMGDFNSETSDEFLHEFCEIYNFKNLIKEPTCFKNQENPSCIDLILANKFRAFQNSSVIETGLSDFHKLTLTVMKTSFKKKPPKIVSNRGYKNYYHDNFRRDLEYTLPREKLSCISNDEFVNTFMVIFEKHAPIKRKYVRLNHAPFMTKGLRKAVMKRSRLRNTCNRDKSKSSNSKLAYTKQRNVCTSSFRKAKRDYYSNLNPSDVKNTKIFWKTTKPVFSDKVLSDEHITLVENDDITDECGKSRKYLVSFSVML